MTGVLDERLLDVMAADHLGLHLMIPVRPGYWKHIRDIGTSVDAISSAERERRFRECREEMRQRLLRGAA